MSKRNKIFKLLSVIAFTAVIYMGIGNIALAADASTALTNAGITKGSVTDNSSGLFGDLKKVVYLIMGIGGLWAVGWLIIGGMLLAGSGSNPQKRSGGIAAIMAACIGVYIIYKAYDIAGYAVNLS